MAKHGFNVMDSDMHIFWPIFQKSEQFPLKWVRNGSG